MEKAYNFPFDKGYLAWLDEELRYSSLSGKEQQEVAESSKYQRAYERQTSKSYKDGSSLGSPSHPLFTGFTTAYVNYVASEMGNNWATFVDAYKNDPNSMFGRMATNILNSPRIQSGYTDKTGNDPKGGAKKEEKKEPSFTAEYRAWVRSELNPKSPAEEDQVLNDPKAQNMYNQKTGKNAKE
jgi:hypothetical protein